MVTELVVASLPVLRRGLVPALVGLLVAVLAAAALGAMVGGAIVLLVPSGRQDVALALAIGAGVPALLATLAAGPLPGFALALDGDPALGAVLREVFRALPHLVLVAVPGLLGIVTFGSSVMIFVVTVIEGLRSLPTEAVAGLIALSLVLVPSCAHIWVRTFAAPACALVVERVGAFEVFSLADRAIGRRRSLLVVSVLLPLVPLLVTLPDSVAVRAVASFGISPAPILAVRAVVGGLALLATLLLSVALPVVAYALATERPIRPLESE